MKKLSFLFIFSAILLNLSAQKREFFPYLVNVGYGLYVPRDYTSASQYNSALDPSEVALVFVKISPSQKQKIIVSYTDAPSDDPTYKFYKVLSNGELQFMFSITADELYIPGNGNLYAAGTSDDWFDRHRKYRFTGNNIKEVHQPFYYVGMKTTTLQTIKLYADKTCKYPIAVIPKGSTIIVVAAEFAEMPVKFLIKSPFGLMGWWKLDNVTESKKIQGLRFNGD